MSKTKILKDYSAWVPALQRVHASVEEHLRRIMAEQGVKIHSFGGRIKSKTSLEQKISRPDRNYEDLWQITDLLGFRFITYSEDVIERVAQAVEASFDMDFENSVNKLRSHDHQRFGYRSLHYICFVPADFLEDQPELADNLRFEIQIRTNLQHTWAEFEHDLGYKIHSELPGELRRRFSQIASLLEVADRELVAIQSEVRAYEKELKGIDLSSSNQVELDQLSLPLLLARPEVAKLDRRIASILGKDISEEIFYSDYLLRVLQAAGFKKARSILDEIPRHADAIESFIQSYFEFSQRHWNFGNEAVTDIKKGYGLLFLSHLSLLNRESLFIDKLHRMAEFYREIDYPNDPEKAKAAAQELINELKLRRIVVE